MQDQEDPIERYLGAHSAFCPSFDPSGTKIAYLTDTSGSPQVWVIDVAGGNPHQLTSYEEGVRHVEWAPAGDLLLLAMDVGGNERHQLYVMDAETGGAVRPLTQEPTVMHRFGAWSPDGKAVAYAANRRDPTCFDIYVQSVPDGEPRSVFQPEAGTSSSVEAWSPDGQRLVVSYQPDHGLYNHLFLVDVQTGDSRQLTPPERAAYRSVQWSEDGKSLYLATSLQRDLFCLAELDVDSGEMTALADPPWDVEGVSLAPDGKRLTYTVNEAGYAKLVIRDLDSGIDMPVEGLPRGTLHDFAPERGIQTMGDQSEWSPDGSQLVFTVNAPGLNPDIWVYDVARKALTQVTHSSMEGIEKEDLAVPQLVSFPSFDDRQIPAFLYTPPDAEADGTNPVVIYVHGGPASQVRPQFNIGHGYLPLDHLVQQGYCVFAPNIRGSTGYGRSYVLSGQLRKSLDPVADLKYAYHWLVDSGWADPKRVGILGPSYGGYAVLAAITTYPDLWAACVSLVGFNDVIAHITGPRGPGTWRLTEEGPNTWREKEIGSRYGDIVENADYLKEISPITHVDRIRTPLLVEHGANDARIQIQQAERLVGALREREHPVEFMVFEDEGHILLKRENKVTVQRAVARFFDRYLGQA